VIAETQKSLSRLVGEDITTRIISGVNLWNIWIDPVQLEQLVMNMAINARDAMPDGGEFTIDIQNVTLHEEFCSSINDCISGDFVRIAFRDTGAGMDQETILHIFEPFFTTKEFGNGPGLGLSTIYGIVRQNDGYIDVYSKPGVGTVFSVYLPRHEACLEDSRTSDDAVCSGSGFILVVEDEEPVRRLTTMFIQSLGYTVYEAEGPCKALEIASDTSLELDLVLTDVIMPEMNGKVMIDKMREIRPDIKVIFVSGYNSDHIVLDSLISEKNFLPKPFDLKNLSERLSQLISSGGKL
jgi:CheY-like chemotaxis protein